MQDRNQAAGALLKALARAFRDPRRQDVREQGIEERDLAFEANLLQPMDVELPRYANLKRGSIVRLLEQMERQGFIEFKDPKPGTLLRVLPTAAGKEIGDRLLRPWYIRVLGTLRIGRG